MSDQLQTMALWAVVTLALAGLMVLAGGDADDVGGVATAALLAWLMWGNQ